MILGTILILLAWIIEMPLWLSVVMTVGAGIHMLCKLVVTVAKICYYGD